MAERKKRLTDKILNPRGTIVDRIPWKKTSLASDIPLNLNYFDGSLYEAVEAIAEKYPNNTAFVFMGRKTTYKTMVEEIQK